MADTDFPDPWFGVTDAALAEFLKVELERAVSERHLLWGASVKVLARSKAADDVLFAVKGRAFALAEVHLTFTGKREADPRWPRTAVFADLESWRQSLAD